MDQMSIVTKFRSTSSRTPVTASEVRADRLACSRGYRARVGAGSGPDDDRQIYPYCGLELRSERALMCTDALRVMRRLAVRFAAVKPHRVPAPG